jgi:hypothetical protein
MSVVKYSILPQLGFDLKIARVWVGMGEGGYTVACTRPEYTDKGYNKLY